MRPHDIISGLQALGYQIKLDGDQVVLKIDAPPEDKKTAQALIDELKKKKLEVIQALQALQWPAAEQRLVEWFMAAQVPEAPFELHQGIRVIDPVKFWAALRGDVAAGVTGSRALTGALQADLRALAARFN